MPKAWSQTVYARKTLPEQELVVNRVSRHALCEQRQHCCFHVEAVKQQLRHRGPLTVTCDPTVRIIHVTNTTHVGKHAKVEDGSVILLWTPMGFSKALEGSVLGIGAFTSISTSLQVRRRIPCHPFDRHSIASAKHSFPLGNSHDPRRDA